MNTTSNSHISSSPYSILAPVGVTLLLLLIFVLAYYFARRQQRVGAPQFDAGAAAAAGDEEMDDDDDVEDDYFGVNEEIVKSFPKFAYSRRRELVGEGMAGSRCSICLLEYKGSESIRMLPVCNHFFHEGCVDRWMKLHSTCPICRISLLRSTRLFPLN